MLLNMMPMKTMCESEDIFNKDLESNMQKDEVVVKKRVIEYWEGLLQDEAAGLPSLHYFSVQLAAVLSSRTAEPSLAAGSADCLVDIIWWTYPFILAEISQKNRHGG